LKETSKQAIEKAEMPLFDISKLNLTDIEKKIFDCLGSLDSEPVHIEEIISQTEIAAGKVNAALVSMRLKGIVKQLPGGYFVKR